MGGDDVRVLVIRWVLHRTEVVNLFVLGDNHHAAGVLSGGALDPHTATGQAQHLGKGHVVAAHPLQVLAHIADGGFLRHRADGAGSEHVVAAEELKGVLVGAGLILTGEVQVNVRYLVAAEAQEGLEGDVEAVLGVVRPAHRALHVRHIGAAAVAVLHGVVEVGVLAVGAAVVGGQRVYLSDARHEGHQGGPHRTT